LSQVVHRFSAATPCAEDRSVRLAPAPQSQGSNWKLPSSVPMAENVMPVLPIAFTFARAAVNDAQFVIVVGSTPAASRIFLL
jgi:hypothetical protein